MRTNEELQAEIDKLGAMVEDTSLPLVRRVQAHAERLVLMWVESNLGAITMDAPSSRRETMTATGIHLDEVEPDARAELERLRDGLRKALALEREFGDQALTQIIRTRSTIQQELCSERERTKEVLGLAGISQGGLPDIVGRLITERDAAREEVLALRRAAGQAESDAERDEALADKRIAQARVAELEKALAEARADEKTARAGWDEAVEQMVQACNGRHESQEVSARDAMRSERHLEASRRDADVLRRELDAARLEVKRLQSLATQMEVRAQVVEVANGGFAEALREREKDDRWTAAQALRKRLHEAQGLLNAARDERERAFHERDELRDVIESYRVEVEQLRRRIRVLEAAREAQAAPDTLCPGSGRPNVQAWTICCPACSFAIVGASDVVPDHEPDRNRCPLSGAKLPRLGLDGRYHCPCGASWPIGPKAMERIPEHLRGKGGQP